MLAPDSPLAHANNLAFTPSSHNIQGQEAWHLVAFLLL